MRRARALGQKPSEVRAHNIRQIKRYFEYAPSYIGPGVPPPEPMGKKHKGSSRPPASDKAMDFWHDNEDAGRVLNRRVYELFRSKTGWRKVYFSRLLTELFADPATVARWEDRLSEEDRRDFGAYNKMCELLADSIKAEYGPDRQINVTIPKGASRAKSKTEARDQDRRESRDEEFMDLARLVERTMHSLGVGASEAVGIVADRNGVSVAKVYEARAFVRKSA